MKWQRIDDYRRMTKGVARRVYNRGEVFYLCPCKLRPGGPWHPEVAVCLVDKDKMLPMDFDVLVSRFEFYNCNFEAGYYSAYYIKDAS